MRISAAAFAVSSMALLLPAFAGDAGHTLEINAEQRVWLSGRSPSLKTVVEDLCYRAGVDLVFYDAVDRPFGGNFAGLQMEVLLRRLLRQESYLVERVRVGALERISTLRVLGDPAIAAARRARGGTHRRRRFEVPPGLVASAFAEAPSVVGSDRVAESTAESAAGLEPGSDSGTRGEATAVPGNTALAALGARIARDPAQLEGFLATDSTQIADAIRRHAGARAGLLELKGRYPDPRITAKIDEIVAALAEPVSTPVATPVAR